MSPMYSTAWFGMKMFAPRGIAVGITVTSLLLTACAAPRPAGVAGTPATHPGSPAAPTAPATPTTPTAPAGDLLDRVGWLAGCWEGTLSSGAVYEEVWLPPRGGSLVGVARMTRDGRELSFEFMRVTDDDGTLVYAAQPSGRPPTRFRATDVRPDGVTFENPGHDFPQRIVYRFAPPDGLRARIEGERDGQVGGFDFPLRRVPCPGEAPADGRAAAPIRIGATMSQTGAYATQGIPARNGYLLCERDVNARGGVLGRPVEFVIHDDRSDADTAVALYERLITEERVDAVMGPYGSTLTEAVAPVTERHRQVHISPLAATSSIWEQGRRYLFMVLPPAELFLAGLIEIAADHGLSRVAIIQEDALFPRAAGRGAVELARERGMEVVLHETYPSGTSDFSGLLARVGAGDGEVLGMAASSLGDFVTVARQMSERGVDVRMFGTSGAVAEFQHALGERAELTFGLSAWEPGLPNPGSDEFVAAYRRAFGQAPSFHAAGAYGACQLFMEAARRAGTLDADALRAELLRLETRTVFGDFAVDGRGYQTAHRGLFIQWRDGEKVVVWPEAVAAARPIVPASSPGDR